MCIIYLTSKQECYNNASQRKALGWREEKVSRKKKREKVKKKRTSEPFNIPILKDSGNKEKPAEKTERDA